MANPFLSMQAWYKRNSAVHGWALLVLAAVVYMGQGGRGYIGTGLRWIITSNVSDGGFAGKPGQVTIATATGKWPWNFKFVLGLVSDNFPIMGYHIKPYMFFSTAAGLVGMLLMGYKAFTPNITSITWAYIVVEFYGAIADVLSDALIVKSGKGDEEDSSSGLQSISWFSLAVGAAIFGIIGGNMSTDDEGNPDPQGSRDYIKIMPIFPLSLFILLFFVREPKSNFRPSPKAFLQQIVRLLVAIFSPPFLVLRVLAWIILSKISHLSLADGMGTWLVDEINIGPDVQSYLDAVAYCGLGAGVVIYYRFFRNTSFRKIYFASQVLSAVIFLSDYILVKRWNKKIGFSDIPFMLFTNAFTEIIDRLNSMPFLVMAAQLCPDNMEATFFSALMSFSNTGSTISQYLGGKLLNSFDVRTGNYSELPNLILIRSGALLGVCVFVFLLPNTSSLQPSNIETLKPTNPTIIRALKFADMYHPEKVDENPKVKV